MKKKDKKVVALVLKRFELNEDLNNKAVPFVSIEGRKSGVISWILTFIGIAATNSLESNSEQVIFKTQSLYGESNSFIPLTAVSELTGGYTRNFTYLMLTVIFIIFGIVSVFAAGPFGLIAGLVLAVIFGILFWLSKRLEIVIVTNGGSRSGLAFKRSLIGNVAVDIDKVKKAIGIINNTVLSAGKSK